MPTDLLLALENHLNHGLGEDARAAGLGEAMARVLLALEPQEGLPMGEVARRVGREASTATRFVDAAVKAGLVERERGADRRRRLVFVTRAGAEVRKRLLDLRDARSRALPEAVRAKTGLGPGEVEWFLEALVGAM